MTHGELWWVDFGFPNGSEAGLNRPAIVVQSDELNKTAINTVIVVPLTSNVRLADYKPNVLLKTKATKLKEDSVALPPLITALDKDCFIEKISKLSPNVMNVVYEAVLEALKY